METKGSVLGLNSLVGKLGRVHHEFTSKRPRNLSYILPHTEVLARSSVACLRRHNLNARWTHELNNHSGLCIVVSVGNFSLRFAETEGCVSARSSEPWRCDYYGAALQEFTVQYHVGRSNKSINLANIKKNRWPPLSATIDRRCCFEAAAFLVTIKPFGLFMLNQATKNWLPNTHILIGVNSQSMSVLLSALRISTSHSHTIS